MRFVCFDVCMFGGMFGVLLLVFFGLIPCGLIAV